VPENLVSFPGSPRVAPGIANACAVFLKRWDGHDIAAGAHQLSELLPEHVPGPLKLVILRALRQLDVPPFPSPDSFREAVARFAAGEPDLRTLADVRRARRQTRLTLDKIAQQAALPVYMLRQLEWGDFRQWHNAEWSERVARAYAREAKLDADRVLAIVEEERRAQLDALAAAAEPAMPAVAPPLHAPRTAPAEIIVSQPAAAAITTPADAVPLHVSGTLFAATPSVRRSGRGAGRARRFGLAAAAVCLFGAGLGVGGAMVEQRWRRDTLSVAHQQPASPPTAPVVQARIPEQHPASPASGRVDPVPSTGRQTPPKAQPAVSDDSAEPAEEVTTAAAPPAEPHLLSESGAGAPAFSPSFSNVGSAVFYHRDEGVGTALVKADRDETTGDLRVINIVEDNARNYHVRPSPDGSLIAFDSDRDGERGVYLANADGSDVRRVSGPGFAAVPSWSPDGSLLAFVRAEHDQRTWNLWLLNVRTNETRRVTDYRVGQPWGASWFPDGRRVAYSHEDRLTVLDLPTGTKRLFKSPRAGRLVRTPAVSPDGRHIVFQVYRDGAWMLDLRDGSMQRILADPTAEEFAWDSSGRRLAFHSRRSGSWSVWIMAGPSS
jgi:Tol biopolymer transport system component